MSIHVAEPPRVTIHPQDLRNVAQGKSVKFSIQSTGTGLLNYKWEWMPSGEEGGAKQWQPCHAKWCKGPTLTISKVDESNEGTYRCVVSNDAGSDVSNPATLTTCKSPKFVIELQYELCVTSTSSLYFCICTCSQTSQNHYSSTKAKRCYSRKIC